VVSLGGVWSICAPDMGTNAVLDRFRQIEPKVLIACDGVTYGGATSTARAVVAELQAALPSVTHVLVHATSGRRPKLPAVHASSRGDAARDGRRSTRSSRCGCPSTIRCGSSIPAAPPACPSPSCTATAASVLVMLALLRLHNDIGCSYGANNWGERYHWYSSTGWVMWNAQMAGLLNGTTCCIYDGNPAAARSNPDWTRCGASPRTWASPSSAPARPSSPTA
jgi:acetoacetyl-CoA synthetase